MTSTNLLSPETKTRAPCSPDAQLNLEWKEFDYKDMPINEGLCWLHVSTPEFDSDTDLQGRPASNAYHGDEYYVTLAYVFEEAEEYGGDLYCHPVFEPAGREYRDVATNEGAVVTHYAKLSSPKPFKGSR